METKRKRRKKSQNVITRGSAVFWLVVIEYEVRVPAENTSTECIGKYIRRTERLFFRGSAVTPGNGVLTVDERHDDIILLSLGNTIKLTAACPTVLSTALQNSACSVSTKYQHDSLCMHYKRYVRKQYNVILPPCVKVNVITKALSDGCQCKLPLRNYKT